MFAEDLALFFSDFAVAAAFEGETGQVLFDSPEQIVADGQVITDECKITYETGKFCKLAHESVLTIDGGAERPDITGRYEVSGEPMKISDGRLTAAYLCRRA